MKPKFFFLALFGLLAAGCSGSDNSPAPANSAPTISAIGAQTIEANVASPSIGFTVMDDQTSEANLVIVATSSDIDIVTNDNIVVSAGGISRSLTITPTVDTIGDSLITIVVTDADGLSASSAFMLTVDPQQLSFQQFVRTTFADAPTADPRLINAIAFDQDAASDDFADLLTQ